IRRIVDDAHADLDAPLEAGSRETLGETLLAPTRSYVKQVLALAKRIAITGVAHITGGGLLLNVPRMLPDGVQARLARAAWPRPAIFDWLPRPGPGSHDENTRGFHMCP